MALRGLSCAGLRGVQAAGGPSGARSSPLRLASARAGAGCWERCATSQQDLPGALPGPAGARLLLARQISPLKDARWSAASRRGSIRPRASSRGAAAAPEAPEALEILERARGHGDRPAVISDGIAYSYTALLAAAVDIAAALKAAGAVPDPEPGAVAPRVALMTPPGPEYVAATWGIWLAGGVAVPLALSYPPAELAYVLDDAGCSGVLATEEFEGVLAPLAAERGAPVLPLGKVDPLAAAAAGGAALPAGLSLDRGALVIYTSGTTGRPKGALHTHRSVLSQVRGMVDSWGWEESDRILHALPLHHVHGIVNALHCAHYAGAAVEMVPKFSPKAVWKRLESREITVFMGVPTMYHLLTVVYDKMRPEAQAEAGRAAGGLRLAVSGSAACPVPLMRRWEELSGHILLERYGMTEIGMALSNPYAGGERRPGHVGVPLPGVEVKVIPDEGAGEDGPGELLVRGGSVFDQYLGRGEATAEAFTAEGFFRTGDVAERVDGSWKILGRASADILKSGGYKLSALEIENVLLENEDIAECAVVGMPDEAYGEVVCAVVAMADGAEPMDAASLGAWCKDRMAPYKTPREVVVVGAIPRNAMGKVNKKDLRARLEAGEEL